MRVVELGNETYGGHGGGFEAVQQLRMNLFLVLLSGSAAFVKTSKS